VAWVTGGRGYWWLGLLVAGVTGRRELVVGILVAWDTGDHGYWWLGILVAGVTGSKVWWGKGGEET
jgi:hypothetical protein